MAQAKKTKAKKPTAKKTTAKKTTAKKPRAKKAVTKKATAPKKPAAAPAVHAAPEAPPGDLIGEVTHFFSVAGGVAAIQLSDDLNVGDSVAIKRADDYLRVKVSSMQIEHQDIQNAKSGQEVGIVVGDKVHEGNKVYKVG